MLEKSMSQNMEYNLKFLYIFLLLIKTFGLLLTVLLGRCEQMSTHPRSRNDKRQSNGTTEGKFDDLVSSWRLLIRKQTKQKYMYLCKIILSCVITHESWNSSSLNEMPIVGQSQRILSPLFLLVILEKRTLVNLVSFMNFLRLVRCFPCKS